jgi:predicted metal-dependent peptidase
MDLTRGPNNGLLYLRQKSRKRREIEMTVYKPGKAEFQAVVIAYATNTASHSETFAVVDYWTSYYQGKFWNAVQSFRAVA